MAVPCECVRVFRRHGKLLGVASQLRLYIHFIIFVFLESYTIHCHLSQLLLMLSHFDWSVGVWVWSLFRCLYFQLELMLEWAWFVLIGYQYV